MKYIGIHVEDTCTNVNLDYDANIIKFITNDDDRRQRKSFYANWLLDHEEKLGNMH